MPSRKASNSLAHAIEAARVKLGVSQNQLARLIGTNSGNLAGAKAGKKTLSWPHLEALALIVGDTAEHLWTLQQLARLPHRVPRR